MKNYKFTLVELLVVIGIIALLAGMIIPAVGMAQISAKKSACISNQGQLSKVLASYLNDNDQQLINYRLSAANRYSWSQAFFHTNKMSGNASGMGCPSIPRMHNRAITSIDDTDVLDEVYGVVYSTIRVSFDFRGTRLLRTNSTPAVLIAPNQLALGGCGGRLNNDQIVPSSFISFNSKSPSYNRPILIHGGQTNIFFMDGHVESFGREELFQTRYCPIVTGAAANPTYYAQKIASSVGISVGDKWVVDPDKDEN